MPEVTGLKFGDADEGRGDWGTLEGRGDWGTSEGRGDLGTLEASPTSPGGEMGSEFALDAPPSAVRRTRLALALALAKTPMLTLAVQHETCNQKTMQGAP